MYFTDPVFPFFLAIVIAVYWCLPLAARHLFLLCASYFFYGYSSPWMSLLLFSCTAVNFTAAILIEDYPQQKKKILILAAILSLANLAYFKYAMFFAENMNLLFPGLDWHLQIALPAGISFFTFQALAYTSDVYNGVTTAERSLVRGFLYISFFPHLVAGPIERSYNLLAQIRSKRVFSTAQFWAGIDLLLIGFLKKLVIADNVALYVNMIFDLKAPSTVLVMTGAIGFGIQILADFSAYTDIARGCGRLMGFELLENFRHPYLARSPSEFWQRWHITLSSVIRDYIYIPLGGSRVSTKRWLWNMLVVWFLCGLWHGAAWNFVVWGLYWGLLSVLYRYIRLLPTTTLLDPIRIIFMFTLTTFGWLIFRVQELSYFSIYFDQVALQKSKGQLSISMAVLALFLFYALPLFVGLFLEKPLRRWTQDRECNVALRVFGYTVIGLLLLIFSADNPSEFYYFQF